MFKLKIKDILCDFILSGRVKVPNENDYGKFTDFSIPEEDFTKNNKRK